MDYLDFKISVEHTSGKEYRISVSSDKGGESEMPSIFPYEESVLQAKLKSIQKSLNTIRTRAIGKRRPAEEQITLLSDEEIESFGSDLFQFLFPGRINSSYRTVLGIAGEHEKTGIRIKLRFAESAAALAPIPWEFLYDTLRRDYVTLDHDTAFVRYLDLPRAVEPLQVTQPLKILGMISNPLNDLDVAQEKKLVEDALADLIASQRVQLGWVDGNSHRDLQMAMRQDDWHVFHYIGHAGFDESKNAGFLLLGDDRKPNTGMELPAKSLARLIRSEDFRLVVLNACEGATSDGEDIFSSTASTLLTDGIPAVLAMQYPITDGAAIELARSFYESVADGSPVDYAITDARVNISISYSEFLEWATPVLFMRSKDGQLFEVETPTLIQQQNVDPTIQQDRNVVKNERLPVGFDPNNVLTISRIQLKKLLEGFTIEELTNYADDLDIDREELPSKTKSGLARELLGYLKRRNRTDEIVVLLNDTGKQQIDAVLDHQGPIKYS